MRPNSSTLSKWKREGTAALNRVTDRVTKELGVVFGGHLIRQTLGVISSAILARGLGPEGLSVFSVIGVTITIGVTLSDFGLSNSTVRFLAADLDAKPEQAHITAHVFARYRFLIGLVFTAVCFSFARPIAELLNLPSSIGPGLVRLATFGVLATTCSAIVSTILQAIRHFPQLVITQILNVSLTVLLMGVLFLGDRLTIANALLVGVATAFAAFSIGWLLLPSLWRQSLFSGSMMTGTEGHRLWRFGRWLWLSTLLVTLLSRLDLLLLNHWTSPQISGNYALALNLALKAGVLKQTLHTVLLPRVSSLSSRGQLTNYMRNSLLRSGLLAGVYLVGLTIAHPFILAVYGQQYAPSVFLFRLLIGITIFDVLVNPLLLLAYPLNMPRQIAASHVIRVATMLFAGGYFIHIWGVNGVILAKLLAKVVGALFLGSLLIVRWRGNKLLCSTDFW